jgi:sRNA-binding carbon storage regulator CsrA
MALVLGVKHMDKVRIGEAVEIQFVKVGGGKVRLAISAPTTMKIDHILHETGEKRKRKEAK